MPSGRNIVRLPPDQYAAEIERRYHAGDTPWDTGVPSPELIRAVEAGELPGKTLLEMGCGTGTNAIEMARRGYLVTAVDLAALPIERAREKARRLGVVVDFRQGDFTRMELGGPFDCMFDLGLYHGIRNRDLDAFRTAMQRLSRPGTRWLSLAGNAREPDARGPPVVTEEEFRSELEPLFQILQVREFRFDLAPDFRPLAWSILLKRR